MQPTKGTEQNISTQPPFVRFRNKLCFENDKTFSACHTFSHMRVLWLETGHLPALDSRIKHRTNKMLPQELISGYDLAHCAAFCRRRTASPVKIRISMSREKSGRAHPQESQELFTNGCQLVAWHHSQLASVNSIMQLCSSVILDP